MGEPRGCSPAWSRCPVAALLAADRTRSLGHALVDGHLVARSGSLVRRRRILEVDHVIGWTFRATWFQRRAGLTTLVATTAGGRQSVTVLDVPEDEAVRSLAGPPDLVERSRRAGDVEPGRSRVSPVISRRQFGTETDARPAPSRL